MGSRNKLLTALEWAAVFILLIVSSGIFIYINNQTELVNNMVNFENAKLVLYEGPKSLKDAVKGDLETASEKSRNFALLHCTDTGVKVDGYDCYVYDTNVNHTRSWVSDYMPPQSRTPITYFDFEGAAKIEVTLSDRDLETVTLSPVKYNIIPKIDKENKKITFTITNPDTYTLTFNDSPDRALHIFANSIESSIPSEDDDNVVYIGPGEWNIDSIMLEDNQTLYIAGGAVIHGIVNVNFAKNVTVKGRGIIDGSGFEGWAGKNAYVPLKFDNCDGVNLNDIIVLNPNAWVCSANGSKNGTINGIKIISSRPNGDGITLQSCENFKVENCFVRSWDDSLVVKNYGESSKDITFTNMQLWTDLAQSMEIGYETNKGEKENSTISNITFQNITVLNNFHKPVISIHNADDAVVENIVFKDIIVENARMGSGDASEMPYLIDLNITADSNWSTTGDRGQIRDITIDNIKVLNGKFSPSRISGFDENHKVENVTITNLEILGEKIISFNEGKFEIDGDTTANLAISYND